MAEATGNRAVIPAGEYSIHPTFWYKYSTESNQEIVPTALKDPLKLSYPSGQSSYVSVYFSRLY